MIVWVIMGKSESCDHYGPDVWAREPTSKELDEWAHKRDGLQTGSENKDGPGRDGSWIYVTVTKQKIKKECKDGSIQ